MRAPICAAVGLVLLAISLQAQPDLTAVFPVFLPPSPELVQYLRLTDNQTLAIRQANNSFQQFTSQKSIRSAQVQREIAAETARPTLDAMALGLRYLELEGIRREIAAEETRTRTTIQAILTDDQKTKVKALEDAIRLQPVICDAQNARILDSPARAFLSSVISPVPVLSPELSFLNIIPANSGCGVLTGISRFTP